MGKAVPGKLSCTRTGCVILIFCFFGQFNAGKTWCFSGAIVLGVLIKSFWKLMPPDIYRVWCVFLFSKGKHISIPEFFFPSKTIPKIWIHLVRSLALCRKGLNIRFYAESTKIIHNTVIILNIGTDRSEQTVQTQIRLLLMEQSGQGLLCLLFCLHLLNTILHCKIQLFQL